MTGVPEFGSETAIDKVGYDVRMSYGGLDIGWARFRKYARPSCSSSSTSTALCSADWMLLPSVMSSLALKLPTE